MRILGLVESPSHVSCRYRIRAFVPALEARGWQVELRAVPPRLIERWHALHDQRAAEVVLLQRKLLDPVQLGVLHLRSRHLIFDFDDAVMYHDSYSPKGPHSSTRMARFRRIVATADLVMAGNSFLAEQAGRFIHQERIRIVPTCVNSTEFPIASPGAKPEAGLELIWIGSSSTLRGVEQMRPLFEKIGQAVPGVRLKVVCDRFPVFDHLPVVPVRWRPKTESRHLATANVGVSWIPDDLWSRGKCGLKVLQYMAAGLPVLANPVGVHRQMIEHGRSGLLVESTSEWIDAIRMLAADRTLREAMGRRGRQIVEQSYSVARWGTVVGQLLAGESSHQIVEPTAAGWAPVVEQVLAG